MESVSKTLYELDDTEIVEVTHRAEYAGGKTETAKVLMTAKDYKRIVLESVTLLKHGRKPNGHQRSDEVYEAC